MLVNESSLNKYISESQKYRDLKLEKKDEEYVNLNLNKKIEPTSRNLFLSDYKNLNQSLANLYQYIHLHNSLLNKIINPTVANNSKTNRNSFLKFKDELKKVQLDLFQARLKHKYITSKVYFVNSFEDSNSKFNKFIIDPKTLSSLKNNQICNGTNNTLTLNEIRNHEIYCKKITIDYSKTNCEIWHIDELSNIIKEESNFRCITRKQRTNVFSNYEVVNNAATISYIFDFKNIRKINNIKVQENSIHKFIIEKDDIEYLDSTNNFVSITNSSEYIDNELIFFPTVETSKIRITFKQLAFVDIEKDIRNENSDLFFDSYKDQTYYYYYDMSLSQIDFFYSIYESQSIYRSANIYSFKSPLTISFEENLLYESENTFVEKYLNITLYGDKESMFLNEKGIMIRDFNRAKPSFSGVIPITQNYNFSELLIPEIVKGSASYCRLTFVPQDIEVYINGRRSSLYDNNLNEITTPITNYRCGNYYVQIINYSFLKQYKASYFLNTTENLVLNEYDFQLEDGNIKVPIGFQDSIGFVQPIIVLRNKSIHNDDTCVINNYAILIEEKESSGNDIVFEDSKGHQQ